MTTLAQLKNDWETLAERDPLHAILTDTTKIQGRWNLAEFLATGELEIDIVLRHIESLGHLPDFRGEALDFGCGVGRLTQPLARRFADCVGVDIASAMVRQAEALNANPHCRYLFHAELSLPFADERFAFIYSNIVLQHVPRRIAAKYLREFVRILAPGGVLVFGVQDCFRAPNLSSRLERIRQVLRIRSRIRAFFQSGAGGMQMHCFPECDVRRTLAEAGTETRIVDFQFTNTGAKDFNGKLVYLRQPLASGYLGTQYCVVKSVSPSAAIHRSK